MPYGDFSTLVWQEEFDGITLNNLTWQYEIGDGCPDLCGWEIMNNNTPIELTMPVYKMGVKNNRKTRKLRE